MTTVHSFVMYRGLCLPAKVECEITKGIGIHVLGIPDERVGSLLLDIVGALNRSHYSIGGKKIIFKILIEGAEEYHRYISYTLLEAAMAAAFIQESDQVVKGWKNFTEEEAIVGSFSSGGSIIRTGCGFLYPSDAAIAIDFKAMLSGYEAVYGWRVDHADDYFIWKPYGDLDELFDFER